MTTSERRALYMERGGVDPLRFDKRPYSEIMNDEIPEARWERERITLRRAGYWDWQCYLRTHRCKKS